MKRLVPAALALTLAACLPVQPVEAPAPGVPDPSGLYCMKQGGELVEERPGLRFCHLPDGRIIEAEAFFRQQV
jgi:putative hemolysin